MHAQLIQDIQREKDRLVKIVPRTSIFKENFKSYLWNRWESESRRFDCVSNWLGKVSDSLV